MKENDTTEVVELLKSYAVYESQLNAQKYAQTYFDPYEKFQEWGVEECRQKMNFIKKLIAEIAPSNEATLLNLHYINGISIEKCGECMFMSRSTAFRLLRKALISVNKRYQELKGTTNERN